MKRYAGILMIALAVTASAQTFRTPATKRGVTPPRPASVFNEDLKGAFPRAVRGGNPLQMLNPNAPAKYGTAEESVILDPDTGKWKGIKVLEIDF
jgi:hypothetical protein